MICPRCTQPTHRLIVDRYGSACADCRGLSENGGVKVSGIMTRTSDRVRQQQLTNEGDMILPHRFDVQNNRFVPNEDFVDRYAEQLPTYFTPAELKKAGYSKAGKIYKHKAKQLEQMEKEKAEIEFAPDPQGEKMAEKIGALDE